MLQRTEFVETPPTEMPASISSLSETVSTASETPSPALDAELAELTACMATGVKKRTSFTKTFLKRYFTGTAVFMVADFAWMAALSHGFLVPSTMPRVIFLCSILLSLPMVIIGSILWLLKDRSTKQEHHAVQRLLEIDDVRAVAPLIDAMGWTRKRALRPVLWHKIERLLPRMSEDDALTLDKDQQYMVAVWLQGWDAALNRKMFGLEGDFSPLGLLHVVAQVGQSSFQTRRAPIPFTIQLQPTLKRWSEGKGTGQDPEVQQAAIACLKAIEQKSALARTGAQLLRASAPTPAGSDTLLRPTQGAPQTDPEELLRPGNHEE